jgi:antibiotic biosynthesis monooxygenase (ABM) superfamily enzyme
MLVGRDDINIVGDGATGVLPSPVSAVISTRIKPGQESAYRAWEQRIAAAQSKAPGFQGCRFEPPIPGVQDRWLAILRFDTDANLQAWLDSSERHKLLREATPFVEDYHARTVRTSFDQWFPVPVVGARPPPAWKKNMLVLLMLYPVVFLFGVFVQTPLLTGRAGMPFAVALFIGNVASVLLLNYLVSWTSNCFSWWLQPVGANASTAPEQRCWSRSTCSWYWRSGACFERRALQQKRPLNVRFGSLSDIVQSPNYARITRQNGHGSARSSRQLRANLGSGRDRDWEA